MNSIQRPLISLVIVINFCISLSAQDINVRTICGTDTIKICLDNYLFGKVDWQESADGINWINIQDAHDTVLIYHTNEEKYVRGCITTTECEQVFSDPAQIRQIPVAFAGMDKDVMGGMITLKGNQIDGATGTWNIHSGFTGNISNKKSALTGFQINDEMMAGDSSVYVLSWTLENECGSTIDTLVITFIENTYNLNQILVDTTDILISELSDTAAGIYCIQFSDTNAVNESEINDSTLLIGYAGNGFLRLIDSLQSGENDSMYIFYTSAATIDDLILDGVLNLGDDLVNMNDPEKSSFNANILNRLPTRMELQTDPKFRDGVFVYQYPDENTYSPFVKSANAEGRGFETELGGEFVFENKDSNITFTVGMNGYMRFDPNFIFNYRFSRFRLQHLTTGMENALFEDSLSINMKVEYEGGDTMELNGSKSKELFKKKKKKVIIAGGAPIVVVTTFSSHFSVIPHLDAELSAYYSLKRSSTFSAYMVYKRKKGVKAVVNKGNSSRQTYYEVAFSGSAGVKLVLDTRLDMMLYGVIGPYLALPVSLDPGICYNGRKNESLPDWQDTWGFNVPLSIDASVGCKMKMFKKVIFNRSTSMNLYKNGFFYPYSLNIISGNHQSAAPGAKLPEPFKLQVKNNWGGSAPGIPVYFSSVYGDGDLDEWRVLSDRNGYVENNLTLRSNDRNRIKVEAFNCDFEPIDEGGELFLDVNSLCKNSSLQLKFEFLEDETVKPIAVMGKEPYIYSLDSINYHADITYPGIYDMIGKPIYVKDADSCIASKKVKAIDTCAYSELSVLVSLVGTNATAAGMSGTPPYLYAFDSDSLFLPQDEFFYITPGDHKITIRDNSGCMSSQEFSINIEIKDSLVAYYPFGGNANDESGNFHHGNVEGATLQPDRFGRENNAYRFDTADIITIPSDNNFIMGDDFSIVFWAYTQMDIPYKDYYPISIGKEGQDLNGLHFSFMPSDGYMHSYLYTANRDSGIHSYESADLTEWHQYTILRQMDTITLYLDDRVTGSFYEPGELFRNCDVHIGNNHDVSTALFGGIDDIRIYKRALYQSEINGLFHENGWKDGLLTDPFIDPRDGNVYQQVRIGEQVWMTENMKWLPELTPIDIDPVADTNLYNKPWYFVNGYLDTIISAAEETENYNLYGVLYNYVAAQNTCPSGWHFPTYYDWLELVSYISDDIYFEFHPYPDSSFHSLTAGSHLKADWGWGDNGNGINDYKFSALPGAGGNVKSYGVNFYDEVGLTAFFGFKNNLHSNKEEGLGVIVSRSDFHAFPDALNVIFSIRCIRDD